MRTILKVNILTSSSQATGRRVRRGRDGASINEPANVSTNPNLHVYYASDWEKAFINADKLTGKNYRLRMVDVLGKEVYYESGVLNSQYFTKNLNCASYAKGMYIVVLETEKEKLTKKFVIE